MNSYYPVLHSDLVFCQTCGAVVYDTEAHEKWHTGHSHLLTTS